VIEQVGCGQGSESLINYAGSGKLKIVATDGESLKNMCGGEEQWVHEEAAKEDPRLQGRGGGSVG